MKKLNLLLNPGPTNVSKAVRDRMVTEDYSHREVVALEKYKDVLAKLRIAFNCGDSHDPVLFVSSGTGANEAMLNSIQGKVLVLNNGMYSERLKTILERYQIPNYNYKIGEYESFDLTEIEGVLCSDTTISHVVMTHHETATGVLAPLTEVGQLCSKYGKELVVDTISSLGAHDIDLERDNITLCSLSSNKCLECFPGYSIVFGKRSYLEEIKNGARSFYFDLHAQWKKNLQGENLFTIPVQLLFALDAALDELLEEGVSNRIVRYRINYQRLKSGLQAAGYVIVQQPQGMESNYLIRLETPVGKSFESLCQFMKENDITVYSPEVIKNCGHFLVAGMGSITTEDIDRVILLFQKFIDKEEV